MPIQFESMKRKSDRRVCLHWVSFHAVGFRLFNGFKNKHSQRERASKRGSEAERKRWSKSMVYLLAFYTIEWRIYCAWNIVKWLGVHVIASMPWIYHSISWCSNSIERGLSASLISFSVLSLWNCREENEKNRKIPHKVPLINHIKFHFFPSAFLHFTQTSSFSFVEPFANAENN